MATTRRLARTLGTLAAAVALTGIDAPLAAQTSPIGGATRAPSANPRRETLLRMMRTVTVDQSDTRLEDWVKFLQDVTGANLEPLWAGDRNVDGLEKDKLVSAKVTDGTALSLLEKILEKARDDFAGENTWQLSEDGALQIGPKSRLNKYRRVEIYDINDLLLEIPDYPEVPEIDLQSVLQSSGQGGGGGGQSPFRNDQQQQNRQLDEQRRVDRANDLIDLIIGIVEPEQWIDSGGEGASIRLWRGSLLVNAPDYIHRGLNGYSWWPSKPPFTVAQKIDGRRYVSLGMDTGVARIHGFTPAEVSAVVGGQIRRSGDPGGGG